MESGYKTNHTFATEQDDLSQHLDNDSGNSLWNRCYNFCFQAIMVASDNTRCSLVQYNRCSVRKLPKVFHIENYRGKHWRKFK